MNFLFIPESQKIKSIRTLQNILEDPLKMRYLAKELFKIIDKNCNGFIDLSEMYDLMCQFADDINIPRPNLEEVKEIVDTFDMDGDEQISLEEFEILVREILDKMIDSEANTLTLIPNKGDFL